MITLILQMKELRVWAEVMCPKRVKELRLTPHNHHDFSALLFFFCYMEEDTKTQRKSSKGNGSVL